MLVVTNLVLWIASSLSADLGERLMTTEVKVQRKILTNLMEVPLCFHRQPTCCHDEIQEVELEMQRYHWMMMTNLTKSWIASWPIRLEAMRQT